jgi:dienelactone hydrolase
VLDKLEAMTPSPDDAHSQQRRVDRVLERLARFVIGDGTEKEDPVEKLLTGHLDVKKIGMFGHSTGGANATQMARNDARILAAVNMDGPLFGDNHDVGFAKPYMAMMADGTLTMLNKKTMSDAEMIEQNVTRAEELHFQRLFASVEVLCGRIRSLNKPAYFVQFHSAGHNMFTDVPLIKEVSRLLGFLEYLGLNTGSIEPTAAVRATNLLLTNFFKKHLLNQPALVFEDSFVREKELRGYASVSVS